MGFQLFDQYTYLHFATGIVVYFWGVSFWMWVVLHALFEFIENTEIGMEFINRYLKFWPGGKQYADKSINSLGDNVGAWVGWLSAKALDNVGSRLGWYQGHL